MRSNPDTDLPGTLDAPATLEPAPSVSALLESKITQVGEDLPPDRPLRRGLRSRFV
jgi:hypothetical protein